MAKHQRGVVLKNSAPIFLARVLDNEGDALALADVDQIEYSLFTLDRDDPNTETAIHAVHTDASLTPSAVISALTVDELWKNDDGEYIDSDGYNFKFQPDVSTAQPFPVAGAVVGVRVTIVLDVGQPIILSWEVEVI